MRPDTNKTKIYCWGAIDCAQGVVNHASMEN